MDEKTRQLAMRHMQGVVEKNPPPRKFAFNTDYAQDVLEATLLGDYGAVVRGRDMEFLMDEATVDKVEKVVKWIKESGKRGLLLCGTLGNGKTTMLSALKMLFGNHAVLLDAQMVYDYYRENKKLPDVPSGVVVLLDELGIEPAEYNEFGDRRYPLTEYLLRRYKVNEPIVIATNLTFDQIGKVYGDRLQDRMREMFAMITYREPSYRK